MTPTINKAIENALTLLNQNNAAAAIQSLEALLSKNQTNPDLLHALGLCYFNTGNFKQAEQYLSAATNQEKKLPHTWLYLGISQNQLGKNKEAIQSYQNVLKINPSSIDALCHLALTYLNSGLVDTALKTAKKALKIDKNSSSTHNILGLCYRGNKIEKAVYHFEQSIKYQPDLYDGYHNLIDTYIMYKMYDKAISALKKTIEHFTTNPLPCVTLGKIYEQQNLIDKALSHYHNACERHPGNITLQTSLARCLVAKQLFEDSISILNKLYTQFSNHPEVIQELSNYYIIMKDYARAYDLTHDFISRNRSTNTPPGILMSYAIACKQTGHTTQGIESLESALNIAHGPYIKESVHFSLADLYDKSKLYDNAFKNYNAANNIRNEPSDIKYYCQVIDDIIHHFDKKTISELPHSSQNSSKPVFIVGMPRSGTSLVEQILSSHPEVYGAGEITTLWSIGNDISGAMNLSDYCENLLKVTESDINMHALHYLNEIKKLSAGYAKCTDKLPHNFIHIGLIELLFPNAKIVHCRRHPFDTCLSIYFKNFNDNHKYARNLMELGRFYKSYIDLMNHWEKTSSLSIYNIDYEALVRKPETYIRQLVNHTGLEWDDACLSHHQSDRLVMTPSHDQATKPIYQDAVYRWKNYRKHLAPLIETLGNPEQYCQ